MRAERKAKREYARARRATAKRFAREIETAYTVGVGAGVDYEKKRIQSSTANLTYEAN